MRIAALGSQKDRERQLLKIVRYLAPDAISELLLGRGPIGAKNCARLLTEGIATRRHDATLAPIIAQIEKRAVRTAGLNVIDRYGRIDHANRFADDLLAGLSRLAIWELVRLKVIRAFEDFRSRLFR